MKLITAPDMGWPITGLERPWVFLAGGTAGADWREELITSLKKVKKGVLFNPRREDYPVDPKEVKEQITWEFNSLMNCHIFTMWFCKGKSDQPICMYELGRYLARFQLGRVTRVVIGCEEGYNREQDVSIQTGLVDSHIHIYRSFEGYINAIKEAVEIY